MGSFLKKVSELDLYGINFVSFYSSKTSFCISYYESFIQILSYLTCHKMRLWKNILHQEKDSSCLRRVTSRILLISPPRDGKKPSSRSVILSHWQENSRSAAYADHLIFNRRTHVKLASPIVSSFLLKEKYK